MSKLVCLHGINKGDQFELQEGVSTIGRSPDCEVVLFDRKVSRHHCQIVRRGKHFTVQDLDSTHGTLLNGEKMRGKVVLREGDKLQLGQTTLALSAKEVGGLLEQTATDAARDLEEHSFGFLMDEAAGQVVSSHESHKRKGFLQRILGVFSGAKNK